MNIQSAYIALKTGCCWYLGVWALGCVSCGLPEEDIPAVVDIPVTFQIQLRETLQAGDRPLEIHLMSLENLDCQNYTIDYEYARSGNLLMLSLNDFILNGPCVPGEAVASASFSPGVLNLGYYPMIISLKDVVQNEGSLTVSPEFYSIKLQTSHGILASPHKLYRIPEKSIWGEIYAEPDSLVYLTENFLEELEQASAPLNLQEGYYGYFRIDGDGVLKLSEPTGQEEETTFVRRYQGDREFLIDLAAAYRAEGGAGLTLRLFDAEGYIY